MTKPTTIYEETSEFGAYHYKKKTPEYLEYEGKIKIFDTGNQPIQMIIKFVGEYPFALPIPPDQHKIKAKSLMELQCKLVRWLWKYGWILR